MWTIVHIFFPKRPLSRQNNYQVHQENNIENEKDVICDN